MAPRTAIGLDIGTAGVRAAQLSFGGGGGGRRRGRDERGGGGQIVLERFGQVALPEGAVRDGEVADPPAVAQALRELWAHTGFSGKRVVIGVANQKVVVRQVELPWLPPQELKGSLPFQVQDFVPMPVEHAVLDFHPLEEQVDGSGGRTLKGLLVAAARDMVMASVDAVQRAGLTPIVVDLTSFAVLRSMGRTDELGMGAPVEALVDVGARVTNIVVHEGGAPRFVRILLMGGQDVTDAVAEQIGVPQVQAEAIKQQIAMGEGASGLDGEVAVRVVESTAAALVDEIRGSLDYFSASSGTARINRLVLTGGGARLVGLAQRLAAVTRVPADLGTPLSGMRLGRTGLSREQIDYVAPLTAVPVGLALGLAS